MNKYFDKKTKKNIKKRSKKRKKKKFKKSNKFKGGSRKMENTIHELSNNNNEVFIKLDNLNGNSRYSYF